MTDPVETTPVPPLPQHTPPIDENASAGRRFTVNWMQWFTALRSKVNIINAMLVNFSRLTGTGFPSLDTTLWALRSMSGPDSVEVTNGDGVSGNPTFRFVNDDSSATPFTVYGKNGSGVRGWFRPALFESTGLLDGGALSINGSNPATFDVAAAIVGYTDYSSNAVAPTRAATVYGPTTGNAVTNIAAIATYVGINTPGLTIAQQTSPFTPTQRRTIVPLGAVISNGVQLIAVNNLPDVMRAGINQFQDLMEAIGPINRSGNVFGPNGVNININKTAGTLFKQGANFTTNEDDPHNLSLAALTPASFAYRTSTGVQAATTTNIDVTQYESPLGTLAVVPNNRFTIQRINLFSSNLVRIQYGQTVYQTMADAEAFLTTESFTTEANIADNGVLRGFLILKKNATDLSDPTQAKFVPASKFGGPLGSGGTSITSTDSLPEGVTNLYFTNARALAAIPTGTTGQFLRGDKVMSNELFGDQLFTYDNTGAGLIGTRYANDNTGFQIRSIKARGTLATPAAVQSGDTIFTMQGRGYYGGAGSVSGNMADIRLIATELWSSTTQGNRWIFSTTTTGGTSRTDRIQILDATFGPTSDNVTSSGTSSLRWASMFAVNLFHSGAMYSSGITSMASLAADVNDWAITNVANVYIVRCGATGAARAITGIAAPATTNQRLRLINITTLDLTLPHESASSSAANRFACPGAATFTLNGGDSVEIWYDNTTARWRVLAA